MSFRSPRLIFTQLLLLTGLAACGGESGPFPVHHFVPPAAQIWVTTRDAGDARWHTTLTGDESTEFVFWGQGVSRVPREQASIPQEKEDQLRYEWDFDYGGLPQNFDAATLPQGAHAQNPRMTFATPGLRVVALRVSDLRFRDLFGSPSRTIVTATILVRDANGLVADSGNQSIPGANLRAFTLFGATRFEVQFRLEAQMADGSIPPDIRWDFDGDDREDEVDIDGDGTAGRSTPRHMYLSPGRYIARAFLVLEDGTRRILASAAVVVCHSSQSLAHEDGTSAAILPVADPHADPMGRAPSTVANAGNSIYLLAVGSDIDGIRLDDASGNINGSEIDWDLDSDGVFGDEESLPASDVSNNERLIRHELTPGRHAVWVRIYSDNLSDPQDPSSPRVYAQAEIALHGRDDAVPAEGPVLRAWAETLHDSQQPNVLGGFEAQRGIQFHADAQDPEYPSATIQYLWSFGDENQPDQVALTLEHANGAAFQVGEVIVGGTTGTRAQVQTLPTVENPRLTVYIFEAGDFVVGETILGETSGGGADVVNVDDLTAPEGSNLQDPRHAYSDDDGTHVVHVTAISSADPVNRRTTVRMLVQINRCGRGGGSPYGSPRELDCRFECPPDPLVLFCPNGAGVIDIGVKCNAASALPLLANVMQVWSVPGPQALGVGIPQPARNLGANVPLVNPPGSPIPIAVQVQNLAAPAGQCAVFYYEIEVRFWLPGQFVKTIRCPVIVICCGPHAVGRVAHAGGGYFELLLDIHYPILPPALHDDAPQFEAFDVLYADQDAGFGTIDLDTLLLPVGWSMEAIEDPATGDELGWRFLRVNDTATVLAPGTTVPFGIFGSGQTADPAKLVVRLVDAAGNHALTLEADLR